MCVLTRIQCTLGLSENPSITQCSLHLSSSVAYRDWLGIARASSVYQLRQNDILCVTKDNGILFCIVVLNLFLRSNLEWGPSPISLLISLHRSCSNCFKLIFDLFQTAKVSLDFKRPFASLNDKWINSERELWRWKQAENKWRSTCLNCKSKNWNVFSTLFKQFLIVAYHMEGFQLYFPFAN